MGGLLALYEGGVEERSCELRVSRRGRGRFFHGRTPRKNPEKMMLERAGAEASRSVAAYITVGMFLLIATHAASHVGVGVVIAILFPHARAITYLFEI
jgi:hypothetical protein